MSPLSLRRFEKLVKRYNCQIVRTKSEWQVIDADGMFVLGFAVTHGKRMKANEVKPIYVQKFLKKMKERTDK